MASSKERLRDIVIVQEVPKLDLDLYIQNYKGRTRFERLLLIGKTSVPLRIDALKAAVAEARKGHDVARYKAACILLRHADPDDPEAQIDEAWLVEKNQQNRVEIAKLNSQLNMYKHNLIKESIRMGFDELGNHLESTGDLSGALNIYNRMRSDASTTQHIIDAGMLITGIHIQNKDWSNANSTASKMVGQAAEENLEIRDWLHVVQGVCAIGTADFEDAARHFLSVRQFINPSYTEVASPNDVAIYGGLLALATMNRDQIQKRVLEPHFRNFLELEPHIRRAISMFVSCRFSICLEILEAHKPDCLLDIYLQPCINSIYSKIRKKCIVLFMLPFSCITLNHLQKQFGSNSDGPLELELAAMIQSRALIARIDLVNKVITKPGFNCRAHMQLDGLRSANEYEKEAMERIRRISIQAAELETKSTKKGNLGLPF